MRRCGELVERSFAHILDRGGMRRAWLRGRENVHKRYLIHVAGFNLGVLMRALHGQGTPREVAEALSAFIFVLANRCSSRFRPHHGHRRQTRRARRYHRPHAKRDLKTHSAHQKWRRICSPARDGRVGDEKLGSGRFPTPTRVW